MDLAVCPDTGTSPCTTPHPPSRPALVQGPTDRTAPFSGLKSRSPHAPAAADTCWGTVISRTTLIKQVAQFNPKGVQCHRGPKVGTAKRLQNGMFPEPQRQRGSDLQMEKLAQGSLSQDSWLSPAPHPLHEKAPRQKEISTHQPWTEQTRQCAGAGGKHRAGTLLSPAQEQPHPCNLVRDFRKMSYHCISVFPTWVQGRGPALCRTGLLLVI